MILLVSCKTETPTIYKSNFRIIKNKNVGFYIEGENLAIYMPKVYFPKRKKNEYEYVTKYVDFSIINKSNNTLILDLNKKSITITSSITSDSNGDNIGNNLPVKNILPEKMIGEYLLFEEILRFFLVRLASRLLLLKNLLKLALSDY